MNEKIKIPIAKHKVSGRLITINESNNGLKCECICFECGEDLIAYNNEGIKKEKYFGHKPNSSCKANYESFIHWITKEIFKTIEYIHLPPIYAYNLYINENIATSRALNKNNIDFYSGIFEEKKYLLQPEEIVKIENLKTENEFKSNLGNIRADIVLTIKGVDLIIEPFYSNTIDIIKIGKLLQIDKSTLSLDLSLFIEKNGFYFDLHELETYIREDVKSKEWINIRTLKKIKLEEKYLKNFDKGSKRNEQKKSEYLEVTSSIKNIFTKIINIESQGVLLEKEKDLLISKIKKLKHEQTVFIKELKKLEEIKNNFVKNIFGNSI